MHLSFSQSLDEVECHKSLAANLSNFSLLLFILLLVFIEKKEKLSWLSMSFALLSCVQLVLIFQPQGEASRVDKDLSIS